MDFQYSTYRIQLHHPFTISRSSKNFYDIVFVYLTDKGVTGVGEAAPSDRYNEKFNQILHTLQSISLDDIDDSDPLEKQLDRIFERCQGYRSLMAAFDMALHDLWGKQNSTPLYDYFGANPDQTPVTSFTIGIDKLEIIQEKVKEAADFPILKIKLGTQDDKAIINTIRNVTDKKIRVDANEGWNLDEALRMCEWLEKKNVEFVEQPLSASNIEDSEKLKEQSSLKLIADENCMDSTDIPKIRNAFDGINIKLMKCRGLFEALKMIRLARENDLEIMLGCMVESSVAITAAAHLSPLVDYADLDGNVLIKNDPYIGVRLKEGKLLLPNEPGLGVQIRTKKEET